MHRTVMAGLLCKARFKPTTELAFPFQPLSAKELKRLMRQHNCTMHKLKRRTGFTLIRIRKAREDGLHAANAARDWIQAITGQDPGDLSA